MLVFLISTRDASSFLAIPSPHLIVGSAIEQALKISTLCMSFTAQSHYA